MRQILDPLSSFCENLSFCDHFIWIEIHEIRYQQDIRVSSRCNLPHISSNSKMLRGVYCCHLQNSKRIYSQPNRIANNPVHMTIIYQRFRVRVIGAKNKMAGIQAFFGNRLHRVFNIQPSRSISEHSFHSLSHPGNCVFLTCPFMVIFRSTGNVSVKRNSQIRCSKMPADNFPGLPGCCHFIMHFEITGINAGEIHHLSQADNSLPAHRFYHILRIDGRSRSF